MSSNANLDSTKCYTDGQWVVHIYNTLVALPETELDSEDSHAVCICRVPESLSCSKREAFIPQFVGLGPYHHFHEGLIMTEQNKLAAAKRVLNDLLPDNMALFQQRISDFGSHIETFYHPDVKFTYNHHTLSYVLTVDGLFLLAFMTLLITSPNPDAEFSNFLTGNLKMLLFNTAGVELTKNALIREVFMLENQIPFHVLEHISGQKIHSESNGEGLGSNVENFCKQHCPLIKLEEIPNNTVHLLDLMYHLTVPRVPQPQPKPEPQPDPEPEPKPQQEAQPAPQPEPKLEDYSWCELFMGLVIFICMILPASIVYLIVKLFLWVIRLTFRMVLRLVSFLLPLVQRTLIEGRANHRRMRSLSLVVKLLEDIKETRQSSTYSDKGVRRAEMIPCVMKLHSARILFQPAKRGVSSIDFDDQECVFYLPSIRLDVNSEIIIRNLVAYETLFKSDTPLVFNRYVELMGAIIDTPEDVKLLVDNEIIKTELRDEVIVELFKGMSKSIRLTKTSDLDKVINKVCAMFDSAQKPKWVVVKYMTRTVFTAIGGLVFLSFTALQTYCTVYKCSGS